MNNLFEEKKMGKDVPFGVFKKPLEPGDWPGDEVGLSLLAESIVTAFFTGQAYDAPLQFHSVEATADSPTGLMLRILVPMPTREHANTWQASFGRVVHTVTHSPSFLGGVTMADAWVSNDLSSRPSQASDRQEALHLTLYGPGGTLVSTQTHPYQQARKTAPPKPSGAPIIQAGEHLQLAGACAPRPDSSDQEPKGH